MTIREKEENLIDEFALFEDWMQKYEYIIELGKDLPLIDEQYKTEDRLIKGCQSQVWVHSNYEDGKMHFTGDSDAIITKGLISILIRIVNDEKPMDIAKMDFNFINEIGLQEHLSPTRSNGLVGMVKYIKQRALENC